MARKSQQHGGKRHEKNGRAINLNNINGKAAKSNHLALFSIGVCNRAAKRRAVVKETNEGGQIINVGNNNDNQYQREIIIMKKSIERQWQSMMKRGIRIGD
jgi:hypothetical protein